MKNNKIEKNKNALIKSKLSAKGDIHVGDIIHIHNVPDNGTKKISKTETEELRKLISSNKVKKCLESLLVLSKGVDEDLYNQALHQSQRWNEMKKDRMLGLASFEESGLISTRIVYAVLGMIDELEKVTN